MLERMTRDGLKGSKLIDRISDLRIGSLPFAAPKRVSRTTEQALVRDVRKGILQIVRHGTKKHNILQIVRHGTKRHSSSVSETTYMWNTCLNQAFIAYPTLEAFANALFLRLEFLRKAVLDKKLEAAAAEGSTGVIF